VVDGSGSCNLGTETVTTDCRHSNLVLPRRASTAVDTDVNIICNINLK
jgi:hypothetical protein